jgi:PAS domain S-box-containing protein
LLDIPLEQLIGARIQRFVHPDDMRSVDALIERGWSEKVEGEVCLRTPGGRDIPVLLAISCVQMHEKNVLCIIVTDLTPVNYAKQLARVNEQLRESETRLRTLGDQIPGGAIYQHVHWPDGRLEYTYMSAGIEQIIGITADEVMAQPDLFRRTIVAEDWPRVLAEEARSIREMAPFNVDFRQRTTTGEIKWIQCRSTPRRFENGAIAWDGIMIDITRRKRAEEIQRENNNRLRFAIENSPDSIFIQDRELRYVWIGHSAHPIGMAATIGCTDHDIMRPDEAEIITGVKRQVMAERKRMKVEIPLTVKSEQRFFEAIYEPWRDESNNVIGVAGYVRDITGHKRHEEELEERVHERTDELNKSVRQLKKLNTLLSEAEQDERRRLAEVLHDDLQQLLVATKLHLGMVASRVNAGAPAGELLEMTASILDEALTKTRSLSHELSPPFFDRQDLVALLEWLCGQMKTKHKLFVRLAADPDIELTDALAAFLFRAAQELLFNVVKHAGTNKAVMEVRRCDRMMRMTISDDGCGFDPASLARSRRGGFGLFSIQERIAIMGGRLDIESVPGAGSRFIITAPLGHGDVVAY